MTQVRYYREVFEVEDAQMLALACVLFLPILAICKLFAVALDEHLEKTSSDAVNGRGDSKSESSIDGSSGAVRYGWGD